MLELRRATESDSDGIRDLIRQAQINPMSLDWRRFIVADSPDGQLIGCGQLKPHRDGSLELASIAVHPAWRRQGIATTIIEKLIEEQPGDLYLTCRSELGSFYEQFGFRAIEPAGMPPYFKRLAKLVRALSSLTLIGGSLLVMKRDRLG